MDELYESVDMNKLNFKYECATKDVSFYEYADSKNFLIKFKKKSNQIKLDNALKYQKDFLNKLSDIKIGRKTSEQKEVITILKVFTNLEKKFLNF